MGTTKTKLVQLGFPADKTHYIPGNEEMAIQVIEGKKKMADLRGQIGV